MKKIAVIQARMGSKRLPGKVMLDLEGKPVIGQIIYRLSKVHVDNVVLCTSTNSEDDELCHYVEGLGVQSSRGETDDLLARIYETMVSQKADVMARIYGDCPAIDPCIINSVLDGFKNGTAYTAGYPRGVNAYVYDFAAVRFAYQNYRGRPLEKEFWHTFICSGLGSRVVNAPGEFHGFTFTLDTQDDLDYLRRMFKALAPRSEIFGWREMLDWAMADSIGLHNRGERARFI